MSLRGHRIGLTAHVSIERYLIVTVDSRLFAVPADLVHGLLTLEERESLNLLTVQGREYPFLDLAGRLGLSRVGDGLDTRMVLLAQADIRGCIRVDRVQGLMEVERTHVLALPSQFRGDERNWYAGLILFGEGVALGLSSRWLMSEAIEACHALSVQGQPQFVQAGSHENMKGKAC